MSDVVEVIKEQVKLVLGLFAEKVDVEISKEGNQFRVSVRVEDPEELLANGAELLRCCQHYIRVAVQQKSPGDRTHFILDLNNFRKRREEGLKKLIPKMAKRVLNHGQTVVLTHLSSYERMIVHNELKEVKGVATRSIGQGKGRKLIVSPTSDIGSIGIDGADFIDLGSLLE